MTDEYAGVAREEMAAFDTLPPPVREAVRHAVHPIPCGELAEALRKRRLVYRGERGRARVAWLVRQVRAWDRKLAGLEA